MKDSNELTGTAQDSGKGTAKVQQNLSVPLRRLPKAHVDFWLSRLTKRVYSDREGNRVELPEWHIRLRRNGQQAWFRLTANQAASAKKAKEIFTFLEANGWEAMLAKFKPDSDVAPKLDLTVGDFLEAVEGTGYLVPRTFLNYKSCFRLIVGEVFGVKSDKSRFDYRQGGNGKWVERIDSIRLARVTPARVTAWQHRRMKAAGHSPAAIASAKRTANSYVRCARSLFSRDIRKRLKGVQLPSPLPFDGVELFEQGSMKYVSKVDVQALIAAARSELKLNDPEAYKAFLLGLFAGMRRGEIDLAEWRMVDWQHNVIRLEETEWLRLKTQDSAGEITIDPEVIAELRELMPASHSRFILNSEITRETPKSKRTWTRPPRNDSVRPYYRCLLIFDRLNKWLRSKGVSANKPLHEMRKEIGALIATKHGIFAASCFLRHSDITTTARHYADHKERISVGLGKLLETEIKPAVQEGKT